MILKHEHDRGGRQETPNCRWSKMSRNSSANFCYRISNKNSNQKRIGTTLQYFDLAVVLSHTFMSDKKKITVMTIDPKNYSNDT